MNNTKVWSLGDAVIDLLPFGEMNYRACAGGAPANVAIGIAKLGLPSGFIGRVGNDPFGHFMEKTFCEHHVDCQSLEKDEEHRTSTVVVDLGENGERSFTFLVSPSADQFLSEQALPDFNQDILHFCSLALVGTTCRQTLKQAIEKLSDKNGLISFDINLREQMWQDKNEMRTIITQFCHDADILKLSDEELFWLTESQDWHVALDKLQQHYNAPLKLVTKGRDGSIVLWQGKTFTFDSFHVNSIDTTGAGDAFVAGLLSSIALSGMPEDKLMLESMMTIASACGALATTKKGALTALPDSGFLQSFISDNPALIAKQMG
ncbi:MULTISPECIES: aminoimidazole riboside kinase [unclassified Gilliamella]|uniref:aminoimidazole riboside kinase n=1 Tax=unclassified Gilliamella TaxID=2685620 RepID=UPI00226A6CD7|nr:MULTISPECIES: aminoimidazole riboside kinase [unclassified Gilliamella]MCX8583822.1 aminoimidazole riboside kinase [Gilliamella sp. B3372]MCX8594969.1 aminoimidazole riboside kinase [Gilliamella sp. B3367]MCX8597534.1 aminoimidazole riboside kinase [Gilliamella sp. B3493]MCX8599683.1 aminoimidazole riboside kinase [Gilliamella sp. B3486]MCX8661250.1 aminoimidazole riboside kinase [Gilliamella sp. B2772]